MQRFRAISRGIAIATLLCFAAPQAQAIELYGAGIAASQLDDGAIVQVRGGGARHGGGGMHRGGGGMHRGGGAYRGGGVHRGGAYHGGAYRGGTAYRGGAYRGGAYRGGTAYRGGAYRGAAYRGGVYRYGGWTRPGYGWVPGGAIAAGAALGFVSAAAAASWAGAAPGPNLCWYYTDPSRRQGFWDACQ
jgi:hypothetical protein